MRTKTETKRQAILDVAAEVFREMGFERASMSEICQRVGGSKATIYNYFDSKEELFFEVVLQATEAEFEAAHLALDPLTPDTAQALEDYGRRLIELLYSPDVRAVRRLVVSEAGRSGLGRRTYEIGPEKDEIRLAQFLQHAMAQGQLRQADAVVASRHLRALLESEWLDRFLLQVIDTVSAEEISAGVRRAVAVFMAAYGAAPQK